MPPHRHQHRAHGGQGSATRVATPLLMEPNPLGAIVLSRTPRAPRALAQENHQLKQGRLKR
ncbi:MAG TPA: hypothetical protein VF815_32800 [Myxococcaceae bacterium]